MEPPPEDKKVFIQPLRFNPTSNQVCSSTAKVRKVLNLCNGKKRSREIACFYTEDSPSHSFLLNNDFKIEKKMC